MTSTRFQSRVSLTAASTCLWLCAGCFDPLLTDPPMEDTEGSESTGVEAEDSSDTLDPDDSTGDVPAVCGDGVVEGDEQCDDGINDGSYGGCTADCMALGPHCGDGVLNGEEPCDDGDEVDGNGCNVDCVVSGTVLWTVTYDGDEHGVDVATGVATDSEDNIIVAGRTRNGDHTAIWLGKYSKDGDLLWEATQSAFEADAYGYDVAVAPNDDIIVVGSMSSAIEGSSTDAWIRRYAPNGDNLWTVTHNGATNESDRAFSVATDTSGNTYIGIHEQQIAIGNSTALLIQKLDPEGNELWTSTQPEQTAAESIHISSTDELIIASRQGTPESWTPRLVKMSSDGRITWERSYTEHSPGWFISASSNAHGHIAATLSKQGQSMTSILRADPTGEILWIDDPTDGESGVAKSCLIEDNGQIVSIGDKGDDNEIWVRKYGPDSAPIWTGTYNGDESIWPADQGTDVTTDSQGNVIAVGYIDTDSLMADIWIRKFAP